MELFRIADGRAWFYQWDLNQKIYVNDPAINEVHFCNGTSDCSLVVKVHEGIAEVPNILLQMARNIKVYAVNVDHTCGVRIFEVRARSKPADYIYTETEIKRYEDLEKQIEEVKRSIPSVPVKSVNGKTGKVQLTASDVGALPKDTPIPAPYSLPTASEDVKGGVKVGKGLQMNGEALGVVPEGKYELIETIEYTVENQRVVLKQTPDGRLYNFSALQLFIKLNGAAMSDGLSIGIWDAQFTKTFLGVFTSKNSGDKDMIAEFFEERGLWRSRATEFRTTGNSSNLLFGNKIIKVEDNPAICGISMSNWPVGTTIEISGVWKDE